MEAKRQERKRNEGMREEKKSEEEKHNYGSDARMTLDTSQSIY